MTTESRRAAATASVAPELTLVDPATILIDLLGESEDVDRDSRFNISLLSSRLNRIVEWAGTQDRLQHLPLGLFGSSSGAAAALIVASMNPDRVQTVVSRGGRPDLAGEVTLKRLRLPVLLIVGSNDASVTLNKTALTAMPDTSDLFIVPGATHLFEEPGTLEKVAVLAAHWFRRRLAQAAAPGDRDDVQSGGPPRR